jgi:uncharacterized protein (DUF2147 family)
MKKTTRLALCCLFISAQTFATTTNTPSPEQAKGLWLSGDKAAVIEFAPCLDAKTALCGIIVWDKDAGTPKDDCGLMVAKLKEWNDEAWRNGWVHDPRSNKNYKAVVRVKNDVLHMRAFIGTELLGETEEMTRVTSIPAGCKPKNASK